MPEATFFEFSTPEEILAAANALRASGCENLEAYTPYPLPELDEKLGIKRTRIPRAVLAAAVVGGLIAFGILWGTNAYDYPLNVGGRPLNSLPADVPIVFETTVLFGALTAFLLVFLRSGMPRLHHPVMEVEGIETASLDHFWLGASGLSASDPRCAQMTRLGARATRTIEVAS